MPTTGDTLTVSLVGYDRNLTGVEYDGEQWVERPIFVEQVATASTIGAILRHDAASRAAGRAFVGLPYRCFAHASAKFRRPDVTFVRHERLPAEWRRLRMMTVPADLAVEVLSPGDRMMDLDAKVEDYAEGGFDTIWIVSPPSRSVTIHRVGDRPRLLRADDEITGEPFLPGFRCKVAAFFE